MPFYLGQISSKTDQVVAMTANPQDRGVEARKIVEALGGTLQGFYFSFGNYDAVFIAELPDNVSVAAISWAVTSAGTFSKFKTTPLHTLDEAMQAMKTAGTLTGNYKPPSG